MRSSPLMQMDTTSKIRKKGGVEAKAEAPALGSEGAEAKTKRRARRGARAEKGSEAAAESAIAAAPGARSARAATEHARAPSGNVQKVGAPLKKRRVPSETLKMLSGRLTKSGSNRLTTSPRRRGMLAQFSACSSLHESEPETWRTSSPLWEKLEMSG